MILPVVFRQATIPNGLVNFPSPDHTCATAVQEFPEPTHSDIPSLMSDPPIWSNP